MQEGCSETLGQDQLPEVIYFQSSREGGVILTLSTA
jgi:hypothetical protein